MQSMWGVRFGGLLGRCEAASPLQKPWLCRENTEGEYSGLEHEVVPGVVESLKVRPACVRTCRHHLLRLHSFSM